MHCTRYTKWNIMKRTHTKKTDSEMRKKDNMELLHFHFVFSSIDLWCYFLRDENPPSLNDTVITCVSTSKRKDRERYSGERREKNKTQTSKIEWWKPKRFVACWCKNRVRAYIRMWGEFQVLFFLHTTFARTV